MSVKYVLRKFWKCLNPLEMFDANDIKDAKNVGNNQFWPGIEFRGNDDKPDKYPTRDICPVQDPNIAALLDVQLNEIIAGNEYVLLPFTTVISLINEFLNRYFIERSAISCCVRQ